MGKAAKVLLVYYIFLGASSLTFSLLKIRSLYVNFAGHPTELIPMWIPIIIGGMIALKVTIPPRSFRLFVIVYCLLWFLRFALLYIGNTLGEATIFNRPYRLDLIFMNYYRSVSPLDTHLPFVLYWFINYLFTIVIKQHDKKEEGLEE
jgi:hypothetical protein